MLLWYVDKIPDYKKITIYNAIYNNIFYNSMFYYITVLTDAVLSTNNNDEA